MKAKWLIAGLALMNVALLLSHWNLPRNTHSSLGGRAPADAQELFKKEAGLLSIERAQLSLKLGVLSDLATTLRGLRVGGNTSDSVEPPDSPAPPEDVQKLLESTGITETPKPLEIPLLTDAERQALAEAARSLPEISQSPMRVVRVETLLADKAWNPHERELTLEERAQAEKLLQDNHYFTFISLVERFQTLMKPDIPRMQELGAFVEYDPKDGGLPYDGFTINHTEIFSKDRHRMYYFPKDQYADLYYHRQVCQEQAQKTLVDLHRLIVGE